MNSLRSVIVSLTVFLLKFRNCLVIFFHTSREFPRRDLACNIFPSLFFSLNIPFYDFLSIYFCVELTYFTLTLVLVTRNIATIEFIVAPLRLLLGKHFLFPRRKTRFSCFFFFFFWNDNKRWLHVWRRVRFPLILVFRLEQGNFVEGLNNFVLKNSLLNDIWENVLNVFYTFNNFDNWNISSK